MSNLITGPFAQALEARRERYNALFAQAAAAHTRLDAGEFAHVLQELVAPVVNALPVCFDPATVDEQLATATEELYSLALALTARDLLGARARRPEVNLAWGLLRKVPAVVAHAPGRIAAAVTNAVCGLAETHGPRVKEWLQIVEAIAPSCRNAEQFLKLGQVAAWRSGCAHYRQGALVAAAALPSGLALQALGVEVPNPGAVDVPALLEKLAGNPWLTPNQAVRELHAPPGPTTLRIVQTSGDFRGFGGAFTKPPHVHADGETLWAEDRTGTCWTISADVFGAVLSRAPGKLARTPPPPLRSPDGYVGNWRLSATGTVEFRGQMAIIPEVMETVSRAANSTTLVVASPRSHRLLFIAESASGGTT